MAWELGQDRTGQAGQPVHDQLCFQVGELQACLELHDKAHEFRRLIETEEIAI